jgi:hypothetical protein
MLSHTRASLSQACCSLNENTMDFCVLNASQCHDRVALLLPETAETPDTDFLQWLARTFRQISLCTSLHSESLGRHGDLSLVYVMKKVMVSHITLWNWVSFIRLWLHSVVVLPSNCYCADFSAISYICCYLWWRWWFDTLWATFIRFWLHSLFYYLQIVICADFSAVS